MPTLAACLPTHEYGRREMVHLHWPHWAPQIITDVEHQGDLQMMGFVFAVMMMVVAFLFAIVVLILGVALRFQ